MAGLSVAQLLPALNGSGVERGTLDTYRYLEHGAFWAVGALAAIMLGGVEFHIPEAITGLLGAALIVWALGSSVRANRRTS